MSTEPLPSIAELWETRHLAQAPGDPSEWPIAVLIIAAGQDIEPEDLWATMSPEDRAHARRTTFEDIVRETHRLKALASTPPPAARSVEHPAWHSSNNR
jgi:hypothetical protein